MLEPGRNCWRIETTGRAACLVDAEACFAAARTAMEQARHSILLLGWNFAEETGFDPAGLDDVWRNLIGDFLAELVDGATVCACTSCPGTRRRFWRSGGSGFREGSRVT